MLTTTQTRRIDRVGQQRSFESFCLQWRNTWWLTLASYCFFLLHLTRGTKFVNPLSRLLALPHAEKQERGLLYTPAEIAQQPETWRTTHRLFDEVRPELKSFLKQAHTERWG